ncbi:hypothetical protein DLJ57_05175 [Micromonospora chalcea]|nr:hypothetical protein DLJ57_05175 [Micromonospora chalcea]
MVAMGQTALSGERLRQTDEFLAEAWADLVRHDERLRGTTVEVRFDRGVAHLTGAVADPAQLRLVRELIGRLSGVLGVWCRVAVGGRAPVVVDLGCGATKQWPGNLGLDIYPAPGVNAVANLAGSLPLRDASVDVFFAVHIVEHLIDFLPLFDECHRVLRPGGVLHVMSPWWRHVNAVADPTHVRLLDVQTFKGICGQRPPGTPRWYPLHVGCDGAAVFADLATLTGHRVVERYGMTETLITVSARTDGPRRPGTVGLALPGVRTRLVGDDGTPLPADGATMGELQVTGPTLFDGYLNRPDADAASRTPDGWFRTGDVATVDPDGWHRIVGRASTDLIKSGGYRIGAGEVEDALLTHPGVREAAVVGTPHPDLGQQVTAYVVGDGVGEAELIDFVARHLSAHKRPREVRLVDALPRNALGKVQKTRLSADG